MNYSARLALVDDRVGLIVMACFFTAISIASVGLRLYSRMATSAGIRSDDWFAIAALAFVTILNGVFFGGTIQGAITGHSPVVNNWPVTTELEHLAQKYKYGFQTTEKIAFGLIKLSILFLWKRLFGRVRSFSIFCSIMIWFIVAWSIAFFFATLFQCGTRWTWNWAPIMIFLTQCSNTLNMLTVFTATDVFTDFIIMLMPVPIIWKLQMPLRKKLGVTSIFMVGLFTIGAGIGRMYIYLVTSYDKESNPDFIGDFTLFILWSEIEANVAMLVCCMPTFGPIIARFHENYTAYIRSRSNGTTKSKWSLLSRDKVHRSPEYQSDLELNSPFGQREDVLINRSVETQHGPPQAWLHNGGSVIAVGTSNLEAQPHHGSGILTQTEISKTVQPKCTI